jgi:hypothetical protein
VLKLRLAAICVQPELNGEGVFALPRGFRDCRGAQLGQWVSQTGGHGFKLIYEVRKEIYALHAVVSP